MRIQIFLLSFTVLCIFDGNTQESSEFKLIENIKIEQIVDGGLSKSISEIFDELDVELESIMSNTDIFYFTRKDFDFINLYKCYIEGMKGIVIVAPFRGVGSVGSLGFAVFQTRLGLKKPMLIKVSPDVATFNYYDLSTGEVMTFAKTGDDVSIKLSTINLGRTYSKAQGCSKAVINCIYDIYNNRWSFVWAWISSSFHPIASLAISFYCFQRQCFE
jgi:hypothetical protein